MRTPDGWNWNDLSGPDNRGPVDPNQEHLIRWGLTVAFSLFFASLYPLPVVPVMLGTFLLMGALGSCMAAGLRREPVFAPHLTTWDEAAASAALGLLVLIGSSLLPSPPTGA